MRGALLLAGAVLAVLPSAASAQDGPLPDYRDDRSTATAVVESLYNAIARGEYARAWSYFRDEPERPDFESFAAGYADTASVRLLTGAETTEGAAGSIYHSLPVAIEAVGKDGTSQVFAGCYELRLVQPAAQAEPPFQPIGIVSGTIEKVETPLDQSVPTSCEAE